MPSPHSLLASMVSAAGGSVPQEWKRVSQASGDSTILSALSSQAANLIRNLKSEIRLSACGMEPRSQEEGKQGDPGRIRGEEGAALEACKRPCSPQGQKQGTLPLPTEMELLGGRCQLKPHCGAD